MTCDTWSENVNLESNTTPENIDRKVRKALFTVIFGAYQNKLSFLRVEF